MSVLKQIVDRGATVAWSPTQPSLIAVATKEGVGSRGFDDYGSLLELYSLNMQTDPDDVEPLGTCEIRQSHDSTQTFRFSGTEPFVDVNFRFSDHTLPLLVHAEHRPCSPFEPFLFLFVFVAVNSSVLLHGASPRRHIPKA